MLAQLNMIDWEAQVKDVLKNWFASDKLNQNPLTRLTIISQRAQSTIYSNDPYPLAKALREIFKSAIAALCVDNESPPNPDWPDDPKWVDRRWRYHNILSLSIHLPTGEVAARIGLAPGGQYYRDQAKATKLLARSCASAKAARWTSFTSDSGLPQRRG